MKVAGIIAEYNPFHKGHSYHIEEVRRRTGADYVVAVMSGDFVQRGEPAMFNKYIRTEMALRQGVDLVVELPVIAATASAETFARTGVAILQAMGVVTHIGFGCERDDLVLLETVSNLFVEEPETYVTSLTNYLKEGMSYPSARAQAASDILGETDILELLNNPNNILAIEYLKAIKQLGAELIPCPILRKGSQYHDESLEESLASATGIRKGILEWIESQKDMAHCLGEYIPAESVNVLATALKEVKPVCADDLSQLLQYKINIEQEPFETFADVKSDLSNRITNLRENCEEYSQFVMALKTRNITYTSVSRGLLHVLLNVREQDLQNLAAEKYAPYIRVLGFRKNASELLRGLKESNAPVLMKLAQDEMLLSETAKSLLHIDIRSANIYNGIVARKSGLKETKNEYRTSLIYV